MLDGIYLEKLNIPAAVICTEPFIQQGKAMAVAHGYNDYPLVEVFHPIANAAPASLESEGERVTEAVVGLLVAK